MAPGRPVGRGGALMALGATIHKIELSLADMDSHRYADFSLTVARHPSETPERVMVRVLAWAVAAQEGLAFGRGLSTDEDPDLLATDLTGAMTLAVLVGLPDERLVRQFCGRAAQVEIMAFGANRLDAWWQRNRSALARLDNLGIRSLTAAETAELAGLLARSMRLAVSIQDGEIMLSTAAGAVTVQPVTLQRARRG